MIRKFILPLAVLAAAGLGGGGGYMLKINNNKPSPNTAEKQKNDDSHNSSIPASKKTHRDHKKSGHEEASATNAAYMKFSRQFVVPIVKGGKPEMMMIFDINIVLDGTAAEGAYALEPQLRDAMLIDLLQLASEGTLARSVEDRSAMTAVKQRLLQIARDRLGEGVIDILLLDIGLQPY